MTRVLILSGANHGFADSAAVIADFLSADAGLSITLTDDKDVFASAHMQTYEVCVFGTGFTRAERRPDGTLARLPDLTEAQEEGLFNAVAGGKGLIGVHGTGWWIGGRAVDLIGGHANWHPPGLTFTVNVEDGNHPVMQDIDDFEVEDEIYMSAYDPTLHILASAQCYDRAHPIAWIKRFGRGRVFYTTLGHTADTFRRPAMQRMLMQATHWAADAAGD